MVPLFPCGSANTGGIQLGAATTVLRDRDGTGQHRDMGAVAGFLPCLVREGHTSLPRAQAGGKQNKEKVKQDLSGQVTRHDLAAMKCASAATSPGEAGQLACIWRCEHRRWREMGPKAPAELPGAASSAISAIPTRNPSKPTG